ncbi:MAG: FHA domain-containing protein [Burkholderiales bacterium]|nr:FHA domain-containing protein [Burkholderiales bacterium]
MSWVVELLHRDGSVLARVPVIAPPADSTDSSTGIRIGRALDNDLVLDDPHCAAHHARLDVAADGTARLIDLGTRNGIISAHNKRAAVFDVSNDAPFRLGQSHIRARSSHWAVPAERLLSRRPEWPLALLGFVLVLAHGAWQLWLNDLQEKSPPYLYGLGSLAAVLCMWSAMYALFGRLLTGAERFFSHLAIASTGYLAATLILNSLELLAFSASWLWPLRITQPVVVIVAAMTVRVHLRLADPRHWRTLRIGVVVVASLAIVIPLAQHWVSHKRLTDVQTINVIEHPALRIAQPVSLQAFSAAAASLKERVDKARKNDDDDGDGMFAGGDVFQ